MESHPNCNYDYLEVNIVQIVNCSGTMCNILQIFSCSGTVFYIEQIVICSGTKLDILQIVFLALCLIFDRFSIVMTLNHITDT